MELKLKQIVGQATVNRSDLDSLTIPLPSLELQRSMVMKLSDELRAATSLREALMQRASELDMLPAGFLREAFGGNI